MTRTLSARLVLLVASLVLTASVAGAQPRLLGCDATTQTLLEIDPESGAHTVIGPIGDPVPGALAFDPDNQILYAASTGNHHLMTIDPESGDTTVIGPFGGSPFMHGMEFHSGNGMLYGHGALDGVLYRIDVNTGAATAVGPTGLGGSSFGSMAYDPVSDVMYFGHTGQASLYRIDVESGAATLVGPFGAGEQLVGMAYHPDVGLLATDNRRSATPPDRLYRVDPESGLATLVGEIDAGNVLGLAFVFKDSCDPCDTNCDGVVDAFDIEPFILCLVSGCGFGGPCSPCAADVNADGVVDAFDIEPFINCLVGP